MAIYVAIFYYNNKEFLILYNMMLSKVIEILFEVFKTHFIFYYFCIFKAILNLIWCNFFSEKLEHFKYISW